MSDTVETPRVGGEIEQALAWINESRKVALATVLRTWGSAPRAAGSYLIIDGEGNFHGSVSGGCVEGAVITEAIDIIDTGGVRKLEFGVSDDTAWEVGLSCGGKIEILIEYLIPEKIEILDRIRQLRSERRPVACCVTQENGMEGLIEPSQISDHPDSVLDLFRSGKSGTIEQEGRARFYAVFVPPVRIIVVGAVHIAQHLAVIASDAGFDVEIIDPRSAFASADRFPKTRLFNIWPDEYFKENPIDPYCALLTLTHDPKIDDDALAVGLGTGCFYVGALGSRKTHAKRMERLAERDDVNRASLERIHSPIGLNIAAANPAEIAIAIMAEFIETYRNRGVEAL